MSMIRRVVSGQNASGKSVFVEDRMVEAIELAPGVEINPLWSADVVPTFPQSGADPGHEKFFPGAGGYRFQVFTIPPGEGSSAPKEAFSLPLTDADRLRLGGDILVQEDDHPGMHTTDTVDLEIVLSGEAGLELDDGATVFLNAGDCFIQNGTRHRWFNRGKDPANVACVMIGGHPRATKSPAR